MSTELAQHRWLRALPIAMAVGLVLALGLLSFGAASASNLDGQAAASHTAELSRTTRNVTSTVYLPYVEQYGLPPLAHRLGFDQATNPVTTYAELATLGAGWYQNWGSAVSPKLLPGLKYVQTIRVHQKLSCFLGDRNAWDRVYCPYAQPYDYLYWPDSWSIKTAAAANPGSTWLIGNEIDRRDWCARWLPTGECAGTQRQDEILPEVYAVAYHDLYHMIKAADPKARVAVGGLVQMTPLRIQYMTKVWDAYQARYGVPLPAELWNIHTFVLREVYREWGADIPVGLPTNSPGFQDNGSNHLNLTMVMQQVRDFRQWMKARGQQNKDLIISEYGALMLEPTEQQVQNFMVGSFDAFLNTKDCTLGNLYDDCRLVQRWAWYSLDDFVYNLNGKLFDPNTHQITGTGKVYRDYARTR